jgi:Icc-related predicted phosphoesterase
MRIQYFSDIHLEFGPAPLPATDADVIVAAGDIGVGASGVEWLRASGKPTIYVAGNHEYYGGDLPEVQQDIAAAAAGSNVHFLECASAEIDGTRFLGATLWTDFMGANVQLMEALREHMNDYQQIGYGGRGLVPQDLVAIHLASRDWLERELARPYSGRTIVVTHHAPLFASWHAAPTSIFKSAYCNNLSRLILDHRIDLWIHGHVHARSDYRANTLRIVCNPRGYDGYQLVDGFDAARSVALG